MCMKQVLVHISKCLIILLLWSVMEAAQMLGVTGLIHLFGNYEELSFSNLLFLTFYLNKNDEKV